MKNRYWIALGAAVLAATLLAQLLGPHSEDAPWYETVPGFWAVYGLAGGAAVIAMAKLIGKIVQRRPDYYRER